MGKIITLRELLPALQGLRVVFTNGCFDLLHIGHLRTLQWARAQGQVLVVGINSDSSVRQLKGPSRPIVNQQERAELLAGFACVDYVIIFDQADPRILLEQIRPAVHVKGGDYQADQLPETALVRSWGGEVLLTPMIPGHSTTTIEAKLREDPHNRQQPG